MKIITHKGKLIIGTIRQIKTFLKQKENDKKRMAKRLRRNKSYDDYI